MRTKPVTIEQVGEFGLINRITRRIKLDASVVVGSGDDCAVLAYNSRYYQLFTCDMIVEGVDFKRTADWRLVGRKALAVSLSDIAACGGLPRHAVVSLGLPRSTRVSTVKGICQGMFALAREFKVNIVGGDISRSRQLTIDVSMVGLVEKGKLVLRRGAQVGDFIFVTGPLGDSKRGKHLTFMPRIRMSRYLVSHYRPSAMIDISDGLAQDLGHILTASRVGAVLYADLIPRAFSSTSLSGALHDGEDFELLFTMPPARARRLLRNKRTRFFLIGQVTGKQSGLRLVDRHCRAQAIQTTGYRHF